MSIGVNRTGTPGTSVEVNGFASTAARARAPPEGFQAAPSSPPSEWP
jgi:hypothetical protein